MILKRELGVSIYPDHSDSQKDRQYLKRAAELGFTRLFMSMLEVSEGKEAVKAKFQSIIHYAKELGFEVSLDVSPMIFTQLGISYQDLGFFAELGADIVRLDESFDSATEAMLTYNPYQLNIELNMSNNVLQLENMLSYQANRPFIYGCHNFYPQRNTGLGYDFFIDCSRHYKAQGIKTAAFVSSHVGNLGPWNVNDGLPTLEMHRDLPIDVQAKHLFATDLIDVVIIGNAYASEEELVALSQVNRYQIELTVETVADISPIEEKIIDYPQHVRRGDINEFAVRSSQPRVIYKDVANPAHDHQAPFAYGDVVIGNDDFDRYKNELQIVLTAHEDSRKNKVGQIAKEEQILLPFIQPWTKFKLKRK